MPIAYPKNYIDNPVVAQVVPRDPDSPLPRAAGIRYPAPRKEDTPEEKALLRKLMREYNGAVDKPDEPTRYLISAATEREQTRAWQELADALRERFHDEDAAGAVLRLLWGERVYLEGERTVIKVGAEYLPVADAMGRIFK
jgi:hypothetical protein